MSPGSCLDCLAWGVLQGYRCTACDRMRKDHPGEAECAGCRRVLTVRKRYCRLCWCQAGAEAKAAGRRQMRRGAVSALASHPDGFAHHQLFFAYPRLRRPRRQPRKQDRRGGLPAPPPPAASRPSSDRLQLVLFEAARDFTRFDEQRHAESDNPWLAWALYRAYLLAEARGWGQRTRKHVRRGLAIALSQYAAGEVIRHTQILPALVVRCISTERVAEVLTEMGVFVDDRRPSFDGWLERKLDGLAPGIRRDVEDWARARHHGSARTRPRHRVTVANNLSYALPILLTWSSRYDHLREITRADILAAVEPLHGTQRTETLVALRSLFTFCKTNGRIFANPARRIPVGGKQRPIYQPLTPQEIAQTVAAATPAARLLVALAAVHAAPVAAIRRIRLDHVDLGNRRITIAAVTRPLDELTHRLLLEWLTHRRRRWPNTANPHLIINRKTALGTGPVSTGWACRQLTGEAPTLGLLRRDRVLEEALTHGPDPLRLTAVFGLSEFTAVSYANTARQLLETTAEQHPTTDSPRTQGPTPPIDVN